MEATLDANRDLINIFGVLGKEAAQELDVAEGVRSAIEGGRVPVRHPTVRGLFECREYLFIGKNRLVSP